MRAMIDPGKCQGHGRCAMTAPDVFDVDDDGNGIVLLDPVPAGGEDEVGRAVVNCPERAISIG